VWKKSIGNNFEQGRSKSQVLPPAFTLVIIGNKPSIHKYPQKVNINQSEELEQCFLENIFIDAVFS
jgi:hypothetical protein